jgi:uncharacterized protein YndB with AHSA1/START domain
VSRPSEPIEPIRLALEVECGPEHAFRTWAERTSTWWPADHTTTGESGLEVRFEPQPGGRIFERTADGREYEWGRVLAWEPPHRLVYSWHLRADAADATEVEIRFVGLGERRTRLEIEHRGWERLGDRGLPRRDANFGGWHTLLPHFEAANGRV